MKKRLTQSVTFIAISLILSMAASPALALYQPGKTQPTTAPGKARIMQQPAAEGQQQKAQQPSPAQESAQQQKQQQAGEQARQRLAQVHARRLRRRFTFYYQRLTQLAEKLQARVNQLDLEPATKQQVQEKITQAFAYLETAQSQGEEAVQQFESIEPEQYQAQRQIALQARDQAKAARTSFQQALAELKEAVRLAINNSKQPTPSN